MKQDNIWQNPMLRQSVQAALAVGLSIAFGSLISGRRWYWAAIAAFIVGMGVGSRGEAQTKAAQRIGGTILGILVGIFLASAVSGHTILSLALVLVCIFFAFYAFQQAYGMMIFWITLMLALLYGLLGQFKPSLMVLRLEETAVGSVVGILVTTFVLPTRTGDTFRAAAEAFLTALANTVKQASASREERLSATLDVQGKAQALRAAIGPLKRGWGPVSPPRYRRSAHLGMYCAFLARELIHEGHASQHETAAILAEIDSVRTALERAPHSADEPPPDVAEDDTASTEHAAAIPRALRQAVRRFGEELHDI